MAIFLVRIEHADEAAWQQWIGPHVDWLNEMMASGRLVSSGPTRGTAIRMGLLVMRGTDEADVTDALHTDPFWREGVVTGSSIVEWDPVFGALASSSSHPDGVTAADLGG